MGADYLKSYELRFRAGETRHRYRRKQSHVYRRLCNGDVADVAHLAMLGVRFVRVPVARRLQGKETDAQNEGDGQQSIGGSFRHRRKPTISRGGSHASPFADSGSSAGKVASAAQACGGQRGARNRAESVLRRLLRPSVFHLTDQGKGQFW
jgi:hypothetical protein